ncbi:hypothetical protein, partial [Croceicoccus naphthovorans]|uniref:hypothetical protein n=1 Tax=Croceicoccus naphthovorans TaxID=1348774 RepID=UPI004064ACC7
KSTTRHPKLLPEALNQPRPRRASQFMSLRPRALLGSSIESSGNSSKRFGMVSAEIRTFREILAQKAEVN